MTANESRPGGGTAPESAADAGNKGSAHGRRAARYCPSCRARNVGGWIDHTRTCPVARTLDRVAADDARWFHEQPDRAQRIRQVSWAEQAEIEMFGGYCPTGAVVVRQPWPSVRHRYFTRWLGGRS
jgi:hypothetical protein